MLEDLRQILHDANNGDPFAHLVFAGYLELDEFETQLGRVGRVNGPAFLCDAWQCEVISSDTLTAVIGHVWADAEYPNQNLDRELWRELFRAAGFTVDGKLAERPKEPVEVWRGSVPERRTDWSWSTDRTVAEKFAAGVRGRKPGRLYRLMAPPWSLLCANTERGEAEYVIDTDCLGGSLIEEVPR
jgi:hypothetical protein